ncbi:MAG TPA: serine/threonine-protein kinase [Ktedonobacteraceae bacterium]|jgi:serine/threonine protein kinase
MNLNTHEKLGNYRLIQRLGTGGFSTVYLGEHLHFKTSVAIKILHSRLFSEETLSEFLQEAHIIAQLDHPHIVRMLEFGVEEYAPYMVFQYVPNGTVRQRYPKGSCIPLPIIIQYVKQIAEALQYAHALKLIHRDIKPENFLLGKDDEILLGDFGLAIPSQSFLGVADQDRAGTAEYMAPEQSLGKSSRASDQYALGVVVYEWLCGHPPFKGADYEILHQHIHNTPTPLHELVPTVPTAIEQVVMRALAKNPSERFPQIQDFAQALEVAYRRSQTQQIDVAVSPLLSGQKAVDAPSQDQSQLSKKASLATAIQKWRISRRSMVAGGILGLAALGGVGATAWYLLDSPASRSIFSHPRIAPMGTTAKSPGRGSQPTPGATKTTTTKPLMLQISNAGALAAVHFNFTANVIVTANQLGISATVQVTYSNGNVQTLGPQTTDGNGNATFSWRVHPKGGNSLSAILVASATGADGQTVSSAPVNVKIILSENDQ